MIKQLIKNKLDIVTATLGKHRKPLKEKSLLILGYHRILPETHPEFALMQPGMRVRPETLQMHIATLRQYFEFVDLGQWVKSVKEGVDVPDKSVALTFDDGWIDNYQYAFPILKQEKVPASIFLVSSMIGTTMKFWPERLTEILLCLKNYRENQISLPQKQWLEKHGLRLDALPKLTQDKIDSFISGLKYLSDAQIYSDLKLFGSMGMDSSIFQERHILTAEQVAEMLQSGLVSFASHTRHHYRLDKIENLDALNDEVEGARNDLEKLLGVPVRGFCYPNGNYDEASLELVRACYDFSCTTNKGWNDVSQDLLLLNRILIHDDVSSTPTAFEARIAGWLR